MDAPSRIARDLYFAEALPRYWVVVRSKECACAALEYLCKKRPASDRAQAAPVVVIVDRFLLADCGPHRKYPGEIDRDEKAVELLRTLTGTTPSAQAIQKRLGCWLVTNHPAAGKKGTALEWRARGPWLMAEIRESFIGDFAELRRFGPAENGGLSPAAEDARTSSAERWKKLIRSLAAELRREGSRQEQGTCKSPPDKPIVLLTGAGVSLAAGRYGPGIPATNDLLRWAGERVVATENKKPPGDDVPVLGHPVACACAAPGHAGAGTGARRPAAPRTLSAFLENLRGGRDEPYPDLLDVFTAVARESDEAAETRGQFYGHFRTIMHRFNHGFPYHHWLMARLPWTCIITTNFDGFHERAAAAAALHDEGRGRGDEEQVIARAKAHEAILRRGNTFRIPWPLPGENGKANEPPSVPFPPTWDSLWREARLFKPYGTLVSPATLALNKEDIAVRRETIAAMFDYIFQRATGGWLVVVGHSMQNGPIQDALSRLIEQRPSLADDLRLLWVVPDAHAITHGNQSHYLDELSFWPKVVRKRAQDIVSGESTWLLPEPGGGPLSSRALDFMYDLALEFDDPQPRSRR